jgi:RimJ/RimL family protein N-acetyltransferase
VSWLAPVTLRGPHGALEPLAQRHCDDLVTAVQDGELWRLWYTSIPSPDGMGAEIDSRLRRQQQGEMLPFAVIDPASGRAVGMTNYLHADAASRRLEIGATWYARRLQRSALNGQCKLLLLSHAFEALSCIAVALPDFEDGYRPDGTIRATTRVRGNAAAHMSGRRRRVQVIRIGMPPMKSRLPISTPQWRRMA